MYNARDHCYINNEIKGREFSHYRPVARPLSTVARPPNFIQSSSFLPSIPIITYRAYFHIFVRIVVDVNPCIMRIHDLLKFGNLRVLCIFSQ